QRSIPAWLVAWRTLLNLIAHARPALNPQSLPCARPTRTGGGPGGPSLGGIIPPGPPTVKPTVGALAVGMPVESGTVREGVLGHVTSSDYCERPSRPGCRASLHPRGATPPLV